MTTTTKGKDLLAPLSHTEALALLKPGVALFNSPGSPISPVPEQYSQPSEVQAEYDVFKGMNEAAYPGESKQIANQRTAQRLVFNETMGTFVDFVALGARKDPSLLAKFGIAFPEPVKSKPVSKMVQLLSLPVITLRAVDKDPGTVWCKVHGGAKKGAEIYNAYDDPSNESNWSRYDSFVNGSFAITGLVSGRRIYIRGRYLLPQGKRGPWSEMVSIMVP